MLVQTTRAMTHSNHRQHGTRKRIEKKHTHTHTLKSDYELNKNERTLRLREINV